MGRVRLVSEGKPSAGRDVDIRYLNSEDLAKVISSATVNDAVKSLKAGAEAAALAMGEVSQKGGRHNEVSDGRPRIASARNPSTSASGE